MKPTILDVARMAQVSKSSVSNYLNGRYKTMSADTRARIKEAILALDYSPSLSAQRLSSKKRSHAICVVVPAGDDSFVADFHGYSTMLNSVVKAAAKRHYNTLVFARSYGKSSKEVAYMRSMAASIVDGFICYDLRVGDTYFKLFEENSIPYVCIGKSPEMDDYQYVASDHEGATYEAATRLLALGHKRIAVVGEANSVVEQSRKDGYQRAFLTRGLERMPDYYLGINTRTNAQYSAEEIEKCRVLLRSPQRPTAILAMEKAVPLLESVAQEERLRIPDDLSVIVMEYSGYPSQAGIHYTHVDTKIQLVSELAFEKLLLAIRKPKEPFQSEILPLQIVDGESVRRLEDAPAPPEAIK